MPLRRLVLGSLFTSMVIMGANAQDTKTYRVGVIPTSIPFTYLDLGTNELKGAMIDMLDEMAASGGFNRLDQNMYPSVHEVTSYQSAIQGKVALAVKKDNKELLDKLNAEIGKLKASGRLDEILAKWKLK